MKIKKHLYSDYSNGYFDALKRLEQAITLLEKKGSRSIPEQKVLKEILSLIFFIKLDLNKEFK